MGKIRGMQILLKIGGIKESETFGAGGQLKKSTYVVAQMTRKRSQRFASKAKPRGRGQSKWEKTRCRDNRDRKTRIILKSFRGDHQAFSKGPEDEIWACQLYLTAGGGRRKRNRSRLLWTETFVLINAGIWESDE